jgi:hypothetical protein
MKLKFLIVLAMLVTCTSALVYAAGAGDRRESRETYSRPQKATPKKTYRQYNTRARGPSSDHAGKTASHGNYMFQFDAAKFLSSIERLSVGLLINMDNPALSVGPSLGLWAESGVTFFLVGARANYHLNLDRNINGWVISPKADYGKFSTSLSAFDVSWLGAQVTGGYQYNFLQTGWENISIFAGGGLRYRKVSMPQLEASTDADVAKLGSSPAASLAVNVQRAILESAKKSYGDGINLILELNIGYKF